MAALAQFSALITFIVSLILLIMFIVLCVNVGSLVRLTRVQNEILKALFKLQGGEVEDKK